MPVPRWLHPDPDVFVVASVPAPDFQSPQRAVPALISEWAELPSSLLSVQHWQTLKLFA
jgi:hypothetical protein